MREFQATEARRGRGNLMIGLIGPSGGGKTYSALRLATGIQQVDPGPIFVIDTEARRATHYAPTEGESVDITKGRFDFRHIEFRAPFASLDYRDALLHCVNSGAKTIIIDSMSHEHEGEGGLLDYHEAECQRLMREWGKDHNTVQFSAWSAPKAARERLKQTMLQSWVNIILCYRAKDKLRPVKGNEPEKLGWMPIGDLILLFEMTMCALLLPGAGGVPTWAPEESGEKMLTKLPGYLAHIFGGGPKPLDEEAGKAMAQWAAGGVVVAPSAEDAAEVIARVNRAATVAELEEVTSVARLRDWQKEQSKAIGEAVKARKTALSKR
jgi:hypothetical protein